MAWEVFICHISEEYLLSAFCGGMSLDQDTVFYCYWDFVYRFGRCFCESDRTAGSLFYMESSVLSVDSLLTHWIQVTGDAENLSDGTGSLCGDTGVCLYDRVVFKKR